MDFLSRIPEAFGYAKGRYRKRMEYAKGLAYPKDGENEAVFAVFKYPVDVIDHSLGLSRLVARLKK